MPLLIKPQYALTIYTSPLVLHPAFMCVCFFFLRFFWDGGFIVFVPSSPSLLLQRGREFFEAAAERSRRATKLLAPLIEINYPRSNSVYFVEVKFRAAETFKFSDLPKDYPYTNAYIIVVSKKHIKCVTVDELKNGKEITPTCKNYLGSRKEFDMDKEVIIDFCNFAVKFLRMFRK